MAIDKPAQTSEPIHQLIRDRWSPRSFLDKPVDNTILVSLFEAARWAPSCNNSQPWRFIVATSDNQDEWEQAQNCINERNQRWSRTAPVVGFVCAYKLMANGNPSPTHTYDAGMGMAMLLMQATDHGLRAHQMAGIVKDKITQTYNMPDDTDVVAGFALGYQGDADALPDELAEREVQERVRQPLADMVFTGAFGNTSPIVG